MTSPRAYRLTRFEPREADVLASVLQALKVHPLVAHFERQNTGAFAVGEGKSRRFIRFGSPGRPDIQGHLKGGRALYIEVKRPSGRLTQEQRDFIERARKDGALAFVARSVDDVWDALDILNLREV
jgi:hypothetical protein